MDPNAETLLRSKLEDGEKILWTGKSDAVKPLSTTNTGMFLVKLAVSGLIGLFFTAQIILSAATSGEPVNFFMILVILCIAAVAPGAMLADGRRARRLCYAATDRRLVTVNQENVNSVFYKDIHDAAFMRDSDAKVSLLCGKGALSSRPWNWRDIATRNCAFLNKKGDCDAFIFYALDDAEGLKKAVKGRITAI